MRKLFRYNFPFEGFGIIACVLLIFSRQLGALETNAVQALNHVFVVVILCICVHCVRRTAASMHKHVWNDRFLSFLWCLPVFNLVVTAFQLMLGDKPLFYSGVFVAVSTLFSLPSFFCLYFVFVLQKFCKEKVLRVCCIILWCFGGVYTVLRFFDRIIFPWLLAAGKNLPVAVLKTSSASPALSMVIYALSVVCFSVLWALRGKKNEGDR